MEKDAAGCRAFNRNYIVGDRYMTSVGINVFKGKSILAVMRLFGEVVISPFEIQHINSELSELARRLKSLDGETHVIMEYIGSYHMLIIRILHDAGFYVSVVNAMLVQDYGNNSLRRSKTDKKDIESAWATRGYASGSDSALSQNTTYRW